MGHGEMNARLPRLACIVAALLIAWMAPAPAFAQDDKQWLRDAFGDSDRTRERASARATTRTADIDRSSANETLVSAATIAAMDRAIAFYARIAGSGGWVPIPGRGTLRPGGDEKRIFALRQRMRATGDLDRNARVYAGYDSTLSAAVGAYQRRAGLTPSGIANHRTLAMLNVPVAERLRQLRLNRARIADLIARMGGPRYVLVNIPAYELQAVERGRVVLSSRVIVGKPTTRTPELVAAIKAVNLLPQWHVPQTIAQRALIPHIKKDIQYLDREHIRVFSSWGGKEVDPRSVNWWSPQGQRYVFRQDPGPFNALGVVRIDMPNRDIVYMHDTPLKRLFNYALRPYSAGCVRVQRVLDLAGWLVRPDTGFGRRELEAMIGRLQRDTIRLSQPVPVIFTYVSAWAVQDGTVHFRTDIYEKDQRGVDVAAAPWAKADVRITP
jgi:L,D-transpeptidase YcbB